MALRCTCYSCDNARPEFRLAKPVAEQAWRKELTGCLLEVQKCIWQHIPAETQVPWAVRFDGLGRWSCRGIASWSSRALAPERSAALTA